MNPLRPSDPGAQSAPIYPSDRYRLKRIGEPRHSGAAAYVWRDVAEELMVAALYRPDRYQSALLVGRFGHGPGGAFVEVRGFSDLATHDDALGMLEDLADDWQLTANRLERTYTDMHLVGWVSFRPGGRSVLSEREELAHRTFFNLPHQLLVAVDPVAETWGLYGTDRKGYLINIGFNLVTRIDKCTSSTSTPVKSSTPVETPPSRSTSSSPAEE